MMEVLVQKQDRYEKMFMLKLKFVKSGILGTGPPLGGRLWILFFSLLTTTLKALWRGDWRGRIAELVNPEAREIRGVLMSLQLEKSSYVDLAV